MGGPMIPSGHPVVVGFAIAEVARRVGVSTSTVRAWERRYGIGPSARTAGGHRRYTSADLAALQRLRGLTESGLPTSSAAVLAHEPPLSEPSRRSRFAEDVDSLDAHRVTRAAERILAHLGAVGAWTEVFAPCLRALGERWQHTGQGVEREHLAVAALRTVLAGHHLRRAPREPRVRVLAAATPGEQHTLPLDALGAALADVGVRTCVLGTSPPPALHAAIRDTAPTAVVLWALGDGDRELVRQLSAGVPVVHTAGPGWRAPHDVPHLADLAGAVRALAGLTP
jgi:DNA-binding transcriptional MerR regulator